MAKPIDQERMSTLTGSDDYARRFIDPGTFKETDLSGVRFLGCRVDTVRQLYRGSIPSQLLEQLAEVSGIAEFFGHEWHVGRVGRDSGYQIKLQNADLGLIILLKNHNVKAEVEGPHLKFEVSPHLIDQHSPAQLQSLLDDLAGQILDDCRPNQCAVHLALDFQGWQPPADFVARLHCRARAQREFSTVERIEFDERSAVYGRGMSYLFGSAGAVQLALYCKTAQARATDKLDYWEDVWRRQDNPFDAADPGNYDPAVPVWRLEVRFHHSVVDQFAQGSVNLHTGEIIDTSTFGELSAHLQGLWGYGLTAFKLLSRPGCYDAFWTLIRHDVTVMVSADSLSDEVEYRRRYKTANGFSGKNVELFMGNFVSLLARERVGAAKAFDRLKDWECWPVIRDHFSDKGKTEKDVYAWLRDKLTERTVRWGRAV